MKENWCGIALQETSMTRPLSVLPPGLKMARAGGNPLSNSPSAPPATHRTAAGLFVGFFCLAFFWGEKCVTEATESTRRVSLGPSQSPAHPSPPQRQRLLSWQCPGKGKMAAAPPNQRAAPARARLLPSPGAPRTPDGSIWHRPPTSPPAWRPGWARPIGIKESVAHMCSSVPAGA